MIPAAPEGKNFFSCGGADSLLDAQAIQEGVAEALRHWSSARRVLLIPPDFTRYHSRSGVIAEAVWKILGNAIAAVLPALGTHRPMSQRERHLMFPSIPSNLFRVHHWKSDLASVGTIDKERVRQLSGGLLHQPWPIRINSMLPSGGFDLIISIGQVLPHEVVGMAGYTKNIFVGVGSPDIIHKSHYLGALFGIERLIGQVHSPVRALLNESARLARPHLPPILYFLPVLKKLPPPKNRSEMCALFCGENSACFEAAASLAREVNITYFKKSFETVIVTLDEREYRSAWLGNKGIYRTRLVVADGGEVILLAPGVDRWGEDPEIDGLIRRFGYRGTSFVKKMVENYPELRNNLAAAAHLIHGSSEGRFRVTYAPGKALSQEEVEAVGFSYAPVEEIRKRYGVDSALSEAHEDDSLLFVNNPAEGLWIAEENLPPSENRGHWPCTSE